jgi:hypothetical protein
VASPPAPAWLGSPGGSPVLMVMVGYGQENVGERKGKAVVNASKF